MSKAEWKVDLEKRYCPICHFDTQHAVLRQSNGQEEMMSGCAICNPDRFWDLKLTTEFTRGKLLSERWMPRIS